MGAPSSNRSGAIRPQSDPRTPRRLDGRGALTISLALHLFAGLWWIQGLGVERVPGPATSGRAPAPDLSIALPADVLTEPEFLPDVRSEPSDPVLSSETVEEDLPLTPEPDDPERPVVEDVSAPQPTEPFLPSVSALAERRRPARVRDDAGAPVPTAAPPPPPAPVAPSPPPATPSPRGPLRPLENPLPPNVSVQTPGTVRIVTLEYVVRIDGRIEWARVRESSGDAALDESTRAFVLTRWRYEPPEVARRVVRRFLFRSPD